MLLILLLYGRGNQGVKSLNNLSMEKHWEMENPELVSRFI